MPSAAAATTRCPGPASAAPARAWARERSPSAAERPPPPAASPAPARPCAGCPCRTVRPSGALDVAVHHGHPGDLAAVHGELVLPALLTLDRHHVPAALVELEALGAVRLLECLHGGAGADALGRLRLRRGCQLAQTRRGEGDP